MQATKIWFYVEVESNDPICMVRITANPNEASPSGHAAYQSVWMCTWGVVRMGKGGGYSSDGDAETGPPEISRAKR